MAWADLHNGETVYGKRASKVDKLAATQGLPADPHFSLMLGAAQALDLPSVYNGMAFSWARALVAGQEISLADKDSDKDTANKPAAICFEDRNFPKQFGPGVLLIRQSLAPCTRCRAAFRGWAKQRGHAILLSADKGYDAAPDNTLFIFAHTGGVWQWT